MAKAPQPPSSSRLDPAQLAAFRLQSSGLNPDQLMAATHPGGPLLIVAGAGSGKTRTLVHRVAWLVGQGIEPSRILLLTFTRKAAA